MTRTLSETIALGYERLSAEDFGALCQLYIDEILSALRAAENTPDALPHPEIPGG